MQRPVPTWLKLIIGVLAVSPFCKGLFPSAYQLSVAFFLLLTLCHFLWRRDSGEELAALDFAVLGLAGLYLVSAAWGLNLRDSIQEALKHSSYVAVYWIVSRSIRGPQDQEWMLKAMGFITAILALGSVFLVSNIVHFEDALNFSRLSGPFQYANALAGVMLLGIPLIATLRAAAIDLRHRLLWGAALYSTVLVFVFTYSRIAWVFAPVVMLLLLLIVPRQTRASVSTGLVLAMLSTGSVFLPLDAVIRSGISPLIGIWFGVGMGVSVVFELVVQKAQGWRYCKALTVAGLLLVAAGGILMLPKASFLVDRLAGISLTDESALIRYWTYRDALRGWWMEGPVLGLGGGGWNAIYLKYRSMNIISKLTHSSLLETWTEVGFQGALIQLLGWGLGFRGAYLVRKGQPSEDAQVLWAGAIAGLAGLLLHGLFDFDLWYPAIMFLVFACLGLFRTGYLAPRANRRSATGVRFRHAFLTIVGVVSLLTIPLTVAAWAHELAGGQTQRGNYTSAEQYYERAIQFDPYNAKAHAEYGNLLLQLGFEGVPVDVARIGSLLARAVALDAHDPDYRFILANYLNAVGDQPGALVHLERAVELDPMTPTTYHRLLRQLFRMIPAKVDLAQYQEARAYLAQVESVLTRYEQAKQWRPEGVPDKWLFPVADAETDLYRAEYLAYSGNLVEAEEIFRRYVNDDDVSNQHQSVFWIAIMAAYRGDQELGQLKVELQRANPTLSEQIDVASQRLTKLLNN